MIGTTAASSTMASGLTGTALRRWNLRKNAGGFGEVFKHTVLSRCLKHVRRNSPAPFLYVDVFSGDGATELELPTHGIQHTRLSTYYGIDRLWHYVNAGLFGAYEYETVLGPYLRAVSTMNPGSAPNRRPAKLRKYPTNAHLARHFMREHDNMLLIEEDEECMAALKGTFGVDRRIRYVHGDPVETAMREIPPINQHGLVLFDCPDIHTDWLRVSRIIRQCATRWPDAMYVIFYPVYDNMDENVPTAPDNVAVHELLTRTGFTRVLGTELGLPFLFHPEVPGGLQLDRGSDQDLHFKEVAYKIMEMADPDALRGRHGTGATTRRAVQPPPFASMNIGTGENMDPTMGCGVAIANAPPEMEPEMHEVMRALVPILYYDQSVHSAVSMMDTFDRHLQNEPVPKGPIPSEFGRLVGKTHDAETDSVQVMLDILANKRTRGWEDFKDQYDGMREEAYAAWDYAAVFWSTEKAFDDADAFRLPTYYSELTHERPWENDFKLLEAEREHKDHFDRLDRDAARVFRHRYRHRPEVLRGAVEQQLNHMHKKERGWGQMVEMQRAFGAPMFRRQRLMKRKVDTVMEQMRDDDDDGDQQQAASAAAPASAGSWSV